MATAAATEPDAIFCLLERRARKENFCASVKLLLRNSIVSLFFWSVSIASVSFVFSSETMPICASISSLATRRCCCASSLSSSTASVFFSAFLTSFSSSLTFFFLSFFSSFSFSFFFFVFSIFFFLSSSSSSSPSLSDLYWET